MSKAKPVARKSQHVRAITPADPDEDNEGGFAETLATMFKAGVCLVVAVAGFFTAPVGPFVAIGVIMWVLSTD